MIGLFVDAILKLCFASTVMISCESTFIAFAEVVCFIFYIRIDLGDTFFIAV